MAAVTQTYKSYATSGTDSSSGSEACGRLSLGTNVPDEIVDRKSTHLCIELLNWASKPRF